MFNTHQTQFLAPASGKEKQLQPHCSCREWQIIGSRRARMKSVCKCLVFALRKLLALLENQAHARYAERPVCERDRVHERKHGEEE